MKNLRQRTLIAAILSTCTTCGLLQNATPAMAQYTTLQTPYAPGVYVNPPLSPVGLTPPPPVGAGYDYVPGVTQGQYGPASMMPWVPNLPANTAGLNSSNLSLPGQGSLNEPYQLGPSLQGAIPPPPSTPGAIPQMLQTPQASSPYAAQVDVPSGGVLPDGYAPTARSGRQSTQDFGQHYTDGSYNTDFGIQPSQNPDVAQQPQVSQDGPRKANYPGQYGCDRNAQPNLPNSSYVSVGTGNHTQFQGSNQQARQIIAPY